MTHKEFKNLKIGDCITYTGEDSDFYNRKYVIKSVLSSHNKHKVMDVICIHSKKTYQIWSTFHEYYNKTKLTPKEKILLL